MAFRSEPDSSYLREQTYLTFHRALALGQIAHMTYRGAYDKIAPEKLADGLGFCG